MSEAEPSTLFTRYTEEVSQMLWGEMPKHEVVEPGAWVRTRLSDGEQELFFERDWKHEELFEWEPLWKR